MNEKGFLKTWFNIVSIAIIFAGIFMAFFLDPATLPIEQTVVAKMILGLLGATMMGWGATVFLVARFAFANRAPGLLKAILIGLIIWFIPDSAISVYFGAYFNVIINIVILIAASVPLIIGLKRA